MNLKTTYILFGAFFALLVVFAILFFKSGGPTTDNEDTAEFVFPDFKREKDPVKTADIESVRVDAPPATKRVAVLRPRQGRLGDEGAVHGADQFRRGR